MFLQFGPGSGNFCWPHLGSFPQLYLAGGRLVRGGLAHTCGQLGWSAGLRGSLLAGQPTRLYKEQSGRCKVHRGLASQHTHTHTVTLAVFYWSKQVPMGGGAISLCRWYAPGMGGLCGQASPSTIDTSRARNCRWRAARCPTNRLLSGCVLIRPWYETSPSNSSHVELDTTCSGFSLCFNLIFFDYE